MEDDPERPYIPSGNSWTQAAIISVITIATLGGLAYFALTEGCNEPQRNRSPREGAYRTTVQNDSPITNAFYTDGPKVNISQ